MSGEEVYIARRKIGDILVFVAFVFSLIIIFTFGVRLGDGNKYSLTNGILDLTGHLGNGEYLSLSEWEFYSGRLLTKGDFVRQKPDLIVRIPDVWNNYQIGGSSLSGEGFATYRIHMKISDTTQLLSIKMGSISTAYKLYIDDALLAHGGRVAADRDDFEAGYNPAVVTFLPPAGEFDVIIQVSNYTYARGGIWYDIKIGTQEQIQRVVFSEIYKDVFLIGCCFAMGLFFVAVFLFRNKEKASLYFSVVCVTQIIRVTNNGSYIIYKILPDISVWWFTFLDYLNIAWGIFTFVLLLLTIVQSPFIKKIMTPFVIVNIFTTALVVLTPISFYTALLLPLEFVLVFFLMAAIFSVVGEWKKGNSDAMYLFLASVSVLLSVVRDMLYQANIIDSAVGEVHTIFFGFFTLMLSLMLAKGIANAYREKERVNTLLEEKYNTEVVFLQEQIKPHFLFNTLSAIISISRTDGNKARALLTDLSIFLRKSFDFNYDNPYSPLSSELELVKKYVAIEKARYPDRFDVTFDIEDETDYKVPILILQPLIENAIVHGILPQDEWGEITVSVKEVRDRLKICVSDNGVGMSPEKAKRLLSTEMYTTKNIGIHNINGRLVRMFGKGLVISHNETGGLSVHFEIPVV